MGFLRRIFGALRHSVSPALLAEALSLVQSAAEYFTENTERREWAVRELVTRGIPESVARFVVELAVRQIKRAA